MALKFLNDGFFDGKVGIGTDTPAFSLDVESSGTVARFGNGTKFFKVFTDNDEVSLLADGSVPMKFYTSGAEKMRIEAGGNVGIGTTDPETKLHLYDASTTVGLSIQADNASSSDINFGDEDDINIGRIKYEHATDSMELWTDNSERMRIDKDGNVGINETNPQSQLQVDGGISVGDGTTRSEIKPPTSGNANMTFAANAGNANTDTSEFIFTNSLDGSSTRNESMRIDSAGKVGIGTTNPTENLEVIGDSITRSKTRGLGTNYATPEGWEAGAASTFNFREGFFGGNFINNGPSAENKVEFDDGPFGSRELVWMTVPEVGDNADGGWDKIMNGFNNATNNGFMSVVYVRRDSGTASGSFYHGLSGQATNNLDGTANTNPYFTSGISVSTLPVDVWCVAIGIIYASSDSNTSSSGLGGVYRLDTGERISTATTFRQKSGATIQRQRVFHFYSTSTTSQLDFARPGFYILDGSEPTLSELTAGAAGGDDAFWSASGNDIYNDNTGNVGIGTTNPGAKLEITGSTPTAGDTTLHLKLPVGNVTAGVTEMGNILFSSTDESVGGNGSIAKISTIAGNGNDAWIGQGRPTDLAFFTQPIGQAATLVEAMRIDQDGNVGIGTTNPTRRLEISEGGNGNSKEAIFRLIGTNTLGAGSSVSEIVSRQVVGGGAEEAAMDIRVRQINGLFASPNTVMTLEGGGNVGIGTTNPGAKLDISGDSITRGICTIQTATPYIQWKNVAGTRLGYIQHDANHLVMQADVGQIRLQTDANNDILITPGGTGNVGIGTTNPSQAKLVVNGDIAIPRSNSLIFLESITGAFRAKISSQDSNPYNGLEFYTGNDASTAKMIIEDDGNVGIGTISPTSTLEVSGQVLIKNTAPFLDFSDTNSFTDVNDRFRIRAHTDNGQVQWYDNSTTLAKTIMEYKPSGDVLIPNGKLGIGTTNLTAPLQVAGISEYTNNTTAKAAGLTAGAFYRTGDLLKVVH